MVCKRKQDQHCSNDISDDIPVDKVLDKWEQSTVEADSLHPVFDSRKSDDLRSNDGK